MLHDILTHAVREIDTYLQQPMYRAMDQGLRTRIRLVREAMEDLRRELDTPLEEEGGGE